MMNISIKRFFSFIGLLFFLSLIIFSYYIITLHAKNSEVQKLERTQDELIFISDEIRQSSNNLTKFARLYVITKDIEYKDNYYKILDIRNAKAERPYKYHRIYWDLLEPARSERHPLEKPISMDKLLKSASFSAYEYKKLNKALLRSDQLSLLDIEAFNALDGLYKDKNGLYSIQNTPNQALATKLLYSKEYLKIKEKIMLPIDDFLGSVQERTSQTINIHHEMIQQLFIQFSIVLSLSILAIIFIAYIIQQKIFLPINALTHTVLDYQHNKVVENSSKFYDDEIGLLNKNFFIMKEKLDDDYAQIQKLAFYDPLTNIYNKRSLYNIANELIHLTQRNRENMSLIMIDIDFFKKVNDDFGHLIGDEILKHLVDLINTEKRSSDLFGRFGGEEFILLLPDTPIQKSINVINKLRLLIQNSPYKLENGTNIGITISAGISQFKNNNTLDSLIEKADSALYVAKKNGRNRVETEEISA